MAAMFGLDPLLLHLVYIPHPQARVSFAQRLATCLGAKVTWSLISGHAVNPSMGARSRLPVSHGPETRDHIPSAL